MRELIHSFVGTTGGIDYNVNVFFDKDNDSVSSESTNGRLSIQYDSYSPNLNIGDVIWQDSDGGIDRVAKWSNIYPFAYVEAEASQNTVTYSLTENPDPYADANGNILINGELVKQIFISESGGLNADAGKSYQFEAFSSENPADPNGKLTMIVTKNDQVVYQKRVPAFPGASMVYSGVISYAAKYVLEIYSSITTENIPEINIPDQETSILIDSIIATNETGLNLKDGTATVNASGGIAPYEYSINGLDWYTSKVFLNLSPGLYSVLVRSQSITNQISQGSFSIAQYLLPPSPAVEPIKDVVVESGANRSIHNAFKRVVVVSQFGRVPSAIRNGDFEVYDGQNWKYWTKVGGINVSSVQRQITDANGMLVNIDDYAIRFNQVANEGKYLQQAAIPVQSGDSLRISYNIGRAIGVNNPSIYIRGYNGTYDVPTPTALYPDRVTTVPAYYSTYYVFKMRIKVGQYYLYNADGGNNYTWVNQLAYVQNPANNTDADLGSFKVSFSANDTPVTGELIIQLFGFQKIQKIEYTFNGEDKSILTEISSYDPIDFDDLKLVKSASVKDDETTGITSISDNVENYSQKKDPIDILFGDYYTRPFTLDGPLDNLYAITYKDNYTKGWYEFGGSTTKKTLFGMALAKSILQSFQKPFTIWENGGMILKPTARPFSYLDLFSFDIADRLINARSEIFSNKLFAILGCSVNLKTRELEDITLQEVFDKPAKSVDVSLPTNGDTPLPPIIQDPTKSTETGIFTEEFTNEFV